MVNVLGHKTLISFQLVLPRKMIILQFMHTLTYTFFSSMTVVLYISLNDVELVSALCLFPTG